jgi:hypothetical protein
MRGFSFSPQFTLQEDVSTSASFVSNASFSQSPSLYRSHIIVHYSDIPHTEERRVLLCRGHRCLATFFIQSHLGVFHFFAPTSTVARGVEGRRRRKGLCQEYPEPGRAVGCFWKVWVVRVGAAAEG